MKVVSVANNKGGVGKTSVAFNISSILSMEYKKRVLILDNDQQANITRMVKSDSTDDEQYSTLDIYLNNIGVDKVVKKSDFNNIYIIPAIKKLGEEEPTIKSLKRSDKILSKWIDLNYNSLVNDYKIDYVIIDCAPSVGIINENAYNSSDSIVIVVTPDVNAIKGLTAFRFLISEEKNVKKLMRPVVLLNRIIEGELGTDILRKYAYQDSFPFSEGLVRQEIHEAPIIQQASNLSRPITTLEEESNTFCSQSGINPLEEYRDVVVDLIEKGVF